LGDLKGFAEGFKAPISMIDGKKFEPVKAYKDGKVCNVLTMGTTSALSQSTGIIFSSLSGCVAETPLFRCYPYFRNSSPCSRNITGGTYLRSWQASVLAVVANPEYSQSRPTVG